MTVKNIIKRHIDGHRIFFFLILCLFGLCLVQAMQAPKKRVRKRPHGDRVYLLHADELRYDMYGPHPDAQIVRVRCHSRIRVLISPATVLISMKAPIR